MTDLPDGAPSEARQTLLRALDYLDDLEREHGEPVRIFLTVAYAYQVEGSTIRGWASTDDPGFVTVALLRDVADHVEAAVEVDLEEPDDE